MPIPAGPAPEVGLPSWAPSLERVAAYIPERTVPVDALPPGVPILTFTSQTRPTSAQVTMQIADACYWVLSTTGALHADLAGDGTGIAAVRAAGMAEISWPVRDGDINAGQALLTQADNALKALKTRNDLLTTAPVDPDASALLPVYSFPPASPYGDYTF